MLTPGTRLGSYEIVGPLGAGGMGEVYKARDTRLDRAVAIKVLPALLASDSAFRARFAAEARTLSHIAHQHICVLFDVGELGDTMYIVLEYLEGETLADRISHGALPLDATLRAGVEICRALDTAHRAGIVHRDLKPANVMLTKSGVKLLDFGLAKDVSAAGGADLTRAASLTREGTVVGTVPYMAPELLQGLPANARSDIFALGAVLYEMSTGRRAFAGDVPVAIAASILSGEPAPPSAARPEIPAAFDAIVQGCLARDPDVRWQSAHDVGRQLEFLQQQPRMPTHTVARRSAALSWAPWVLTALAVVAAMAGWTLRRPAPALDTASIAFQVPLVPGTSLLQSVEGQPIAVSPDGSQLAWIARAAGSTSRIWLRELSQLETRPVAGTDDASSLFWSPDSRSLAFFARGMLQRVDLPEGAPISICSVPPGIGYAGTWGADGEILYASVQGEAIYRVSTSGGSPEKALVADRTAGERRIVWPWFLPDGRTAIYLARFDGGASWVMLKRPDQPPQRIAEIPTQTQYIDPGYLVFARNGALLAQRFDLASGRLTGDPLSLSPNVQLFVSSGWAGFSASSSGTIAFASKQNQARLTWVDRAGRALGIVGSPGDYTNDISLSPDGRTLFASRTDPSSGTYDIWATDLERDTETRVTAGPGTDIAALVTPDRQWMIFSMTTGGSPELYRRNLATGADERLATRESFQSGDAITRDGRTLVYEERTDRGDWDLLSLPLDGAHTPVPLAATTFTECCGRLSPDDRLLAFVSDETGRGEVYLAPFPGMMPKYRVSSQGGRAPHWSADGHELFYLGADGRLTSVTVSLDPALSVGMPATAVAEPPRLQWTDFLPMPDGKRFIAIVPESLSREQPFTVLTHAVR